MIQRMIAAGEPITAVITLIEVAARQRRVVPQALLDAVQRLLDEHAIDAEDVTGAAADLNALHAAALTLQ